MSEQLFEFDTSKERKEVEAFDKSLDRLMQTMNKLDRGSLSRFEDEWKKLRDSNNRSVQGMVENNTKLVRTLKDQLVQLERFSREKLKSFSDVKVFQQLSKDAKSNADLIRSALKTLGVELDTLDKKAESAKWAQFFKNFETGVVKADKSVREWSDRLKAQMQSAEKSMGVATPAAARARAEGYTNAFGVFITKGVQDAEDAAFKKLAAGSNGVATQAAARSRAEGYTNAFGMYISKGLQEKEAAAFKALSAGSTGVAVQAAARARAEGYTNAFGVYISKSIQDQVNRVEASASRALSAGAGGVAAQAAARARVAGSTNSLGVFTASNPIPVIPNLTERTNDVNKFSTALKKLTIEGNDAHSMARGLASGFNLLWLTWGNLLPLFTGAGISFGLKKTFDIGSEVEYNIRFMEALGQTSRESAGAVRQALRDIDQDTLFSLTELSKGMVNLGQAGFTTAESLSIIKPAAALATAGMVDLDTSTNLLIQTHALWGRSAEDASKTATQLFQVTKSGVLNVEDLSGSLKYASETNTRFGQSLEDTLAVLASLAEAGLKGASGGTALINFFRDLSIRSGVAARAIGDLEKTVNSTRGATEKPWKFNMFNADGSRKDVFTTVRDLSEQLNKLSNKDKDEFERKFGSDRGFRAWYALIRNGVDEVEKLSKSLKNVDPNAIFLAQQGLMDTTRGAVEQVKSALVGALDKVFEIHGSKFKQFVLDIRDALNSDAFLNTVNNMVTGASMLVDAIKSVGTTALWMFGIWGGFKVLTYGINVFKALSAAILGTSVALRTAAVAGNLFASSQGMGGALSIAQKANLTMQTSTAIATGAASAFGVAATRSTILATSLVFLGRAAAFLANPIVGLALTVGTLGASWFTMKNAASDAMDESADKAVKTGTATITVLQAQINKIRELKGLTGQTEDPYQDIVDNINKRENELAKIEVNRARAEKQVPSNLPGSEKRLQDYKDRLDKEIATKSSELREVRGSLSIARFRDDRLVADREAKELARREAEEKRAKAHLDGTLESLNSGSGNKFGNAFVEGTKSALDNTISIIEKGMKRRLSTVESGLSLERATIEAQRIAGLMQEGQYQAALVALETSAEDKKIAILKNSQAERNAAYEKDKSAIEAAIAKARKAKRNDTADREDAKLKSLINSQNEFNESLEDQLKIAVDTRYQKLEKAAAEARGSVYKLKKEEEEFWKKDEDAERKARALEQIDDRYRGVFDSIFSFSKAEMESEKARTAALEASEDRLVNLRNKYAEAKAEADSFYTNSGMEYWNMEGGFIDPQVQKQYDALVQKTEDMAVLMRGGEVKGHESATRKATAAFEKVRKDQLWSLSGTLADAVTTGLTEGGKQGSQKIRDYITSALKQRFTIGLQGVFNNLLGSVFNMGGSSAAGGVASSAAGSLGGSLLGKVGSGLLGGFTTAGTLSTGISTALTGYAATGGLGSSVAMGLGGAWGAGGGMLSTLNAGASMIGSGSILSGLGTIAGALGPIALGIGLVASMLSKKATPHVGGGAAYGASIGTVMGPAANQYMEHWTIPESAYKAEANKAAADMAKNVATALDTLAGSFGQKTGYIVGTGFADDTSKDGAWGSLRIALGDLTNVIADWGNPDDKWAGITFADGEEGAKQYAQKIASTVMEVINGMDLPQWAARIAKNAPSEATMDDLSAVLESISTMPARMLESFGTSRDTLVQQYVEGLAKGDPTAAGQSVADALVDSIRNSVFSNAAGAIFDIVNTGIVTPVLDAMLNGAALSEALSEAAIQATIDKVKAQAEILNALYTNTEFTSVLETMRNTVSSALGMGGQAVRNMPNTILASTADNLTSAAKEADKAAEEAQSKWEDITNSLKDEALQLSIDLLRAQGQEEAAVNKERDRAIKGFDAYQTGLYDANRATEKLIATLEKQKEVADALADMTVNFSGDAAKEILEYERIAKSLGKYDIGLSIETLMGANRESIYAAAAGFVNLSGASEDAKLAVIEAANSLLTLKDNAQGLNESLRDTAYSAADKLLGKQDAFNFRAAILAEKYTASVEGSGDPARIAQITEMFQNATPEQVKAATLDLLRFGNLSTAAKTSLIDLSTSLLDLIESSEQATNALKKQAEDLMEWVKNLAADKAGLATPAEQLLARGTLYRQDYAAAMSGDEDAISRITNTAQKYIDAQKVATTSSSITESVINQIIAEMTALANKIGGGGFSIPHFATGGYHGGGWAVVGENGRELVNMGASRVYSNADSRGLLDLGPLLAEMRATRASIEAYGAMQVSAVRDASVLNSASQEEMAEDVAEAVGVAVNNAAWMQQSKPKLK